MCGILGVVRRTYATGASPVNNTLIKNIFNGLFSRSQDRGEDSSGVVLVNKKHIAINYQNRTKSVVSAPEAVVYKAPIIAEDFIKSSKYMDVMSRVNDWTVSLIGHTRNSTQGNPKDNRNNHPFICGNILGIHNGVIHNWRQVAKKFNLKLRGNCDSEVIFALISQFMEKRDANMQEAISATSRHVKGGMACAVVDKSDLKSLTLFRRGRPLYMRFSSGAPEIMMFSSESKTLTSTFFDVTEQKKGLNVLNWGEVLLSDYSGVTLDTNTGPSLWVEEAPIFKLS